MWDAPGSLTNVPMPPMPLDHLEAVRMRETRRRRRMLYGGWRGDLLERIQVQMGGIRREAWGEPDLSSNVFRASFTALAVLYDRGWRIHNDRSDPTGVIGLTDAVALPSFMQRHHRDTLGMREMLTFVDATLDVDTPRMVYRAVSPDMVLAVADPMRPQRPIRVDEVQLRRNPNSKQVEWVWSVWDVSDPEYPVRKMLDATRQRDVSLAYLGVEGGLTGDRYPRRYRKVDGQPVLPYAMRHAAITGEIWDSFEAIELVEGSLNCGVFWTFFGHCLRNASWPQRYAINVRLPSSDAEGREAANRRDATETDPATVVIFEVADEGGGQPLIGQWEAPTDPEKFQDAIAGYERRVAAYAGISPADVQRVAGDPRSGFAIALNHEAQREAARRTQPIAGPCDAELLALTAIVGNRVGGTRFPESGYRTEYIGLPPSAEEQKATREQSDWEVANGLASPIDLYKREHPGANDLDARRAIVKARIDGLLLEDDIRREAASLGLVLSAAPPPRQIAGPTPATETPERTAIPQT